SVNARGYSHRLTHRSRTASLTMECHHSYHTLGRDAHRAASGRTNLGSTDRAASREVRRGLSRAGLARFQLCHFAFETVQPAVENVRLCGLHRLFEPAQEPQEPRPAALWARAVRRVVHESSIRTAGLSCFVGWTAFDHASSASRVISGQHPEDMKRK